MIAKQPVVPESMTELVANVQRLEPTIQHRDRGLAAPPLVVAAGDAAQFAWDEFIYGKLRNLHTRRNYRLAITRFLAWCERGRLDLRQIAPADVGQYLDGLQYAPATKKVHLAALRHFFDQLVLRHVVILNPAASVRGDRLVVVEGKTPAITVEQARRLLKSIDTSSWVEIRDRAIIATLIYTAARVGAVARLRRGDFYDAGDQYCLRLTEKGTKHREIPVVQDKLYFFIIAYLDATDDMAADNNSPLFFTTIRRTKRPTGNAMTAGDIARMVKRRLRDADLSDRLSPHSFRVCVITSLLAQGQPLQDVQLLAGHTDPRTTRLYDRRQRQVTRKLVDEISV